MERPNGVKVELWTWTMRRTGLSTRAAELYKSWTAPELWEGRGYLLGRPCGRGSGGRSRPPLWRRVAATCCPTTASGSNSKITLLLSKPAWLQRQYCSLIFVKSWNASFKRKKKNLCWILNFVCKRMENVQLFMVHWKTSQIKTRVK